MPRSKFLILSIVAALSFSLASCSATGESPSAKRSNVDQRTEEVLEHLYTKSPAAEKQIEGAAGYAVFTNFGVDVLFVGGGGGFGVAVDNASKARTYMRMGEASVGFGLGVKSFRVVFVFQEKTRLDTFIREGWDFGADASAAAKLEGSGGSAERAASFSNGVAVYQLTEAGLALRVNVKGTKYWAYDELNY